MLMAMYPPPLSGTELQQLSLVNVMTAARASCWELSSHKPSEECYMVGGGGFDSHRIGSMGDDLCDLLAADRPSHLKCKLQSNPEGE